MSDETLELGQLVADHEAAHDRAEAAKVDLNEVGRVMAELSGRLREHPETVTDDALSALMEPENIARLLGEFRNATREEEDAARRLREVDKGYIVDGLKTRRTAPATNRERDLFARTA